MEELKTIASEELLMEQLTNRDWDKFWLRLMGRCAWLLRKRYTVAWSNEELRDFSRNAIGEIINKIFIEKKRKWYTDSNPDFEDFIISAIDSHINNTLNKSKKEKGVENEDLLISENGELASSTEQTIIGKELKDQIYKQLEEAKASDDEILIFECLCDGIEKPEEIRSAIGLSDEEFHNAWRRFKRKRDIIKLKLAANGY